MNNSKTPSKKRDPLSNWSANRFLYLTEDYFPDFSDEEIDQLQIHYANKDYNQFFLIIIKRVLDHKCFDCDNHSVILGLLVNYDNFNFDGIPMNCIEDIMDFATYHYKALMITEIESISTAGF